MKILILGAAGEIGRMLTEDLVEQTDYELVLYARNASERLTTKDSSRETLVDGDFNDFDKLLTAMKDVDVVYVNDMNGVENTATVVKAMKQMGIKRVIVASILGIYDEVPGDFGQWNYRMVGSNGMQRHQQSAALVETPDLDYTILRLTWLYNQDGNKNHLLTFKGESFQGAQITRQAVAQLIVDIIEDKSDKFVKASVGVGEPETNWDKPSFY